MLISTLGLSREPGPPRLPSLDSMEISYSWLPGEFARSNPGLLEECAALYSNHYGLWSAQSRPPARPATRVRLTATRLKQWFNSEASRISLAHAGSDLVGYAIAVQMKVPRCGIVSWVTQLVVHEQYRQRNIGKTLLFSIWGLSDHFAWGLLTASPYAVRALEKATRRRCLPTRIQRNSRKLYRLGCAHIGYVDEATNIDVGANQSRIETEFYLDHSEIGKMLDQVTTAEKPWLLGTLQEGWEWFAFTFSDQEQMPLNSEEIASMLEASDHIVRQAYARMQLNEDHRWARHAILETQQIIEYCGISAGQSVLDFGCGAGRHALALGRSGIRVTGVDYVPGFIEKANTVARRQGLSETRFIQADCRDAVLGERFDAAVCLYDVVGTYADRGENTRILANLAAHLKPGRMALVSVMNLALTKRNAKHVFSLQRDPNRLLELPSSGTMETTGDVFNPEYYMLDEESSVVYRREQFTKGPDLPAEWVVRDRRFSVDEIEAMCSEAGLEVVWTRFVRAGRWHEALAEDDDRAKEILVLCRTHP